MNTETKILLGVAGAVVATLFLKRARDAITLDGVTVPIYGPTNDLPPVDAYASHDTATKFDPTPKPGALAFRQWAIDTWGQKPGSPQNIGRWDKTDKPSEHHEGRAWDLMTNSIEHGQSIVDALLAADPDTGEADALARRAGIMYMIWDKRIWRAYPWQGQPSGTWGAYTGGESAHTDHIHFSFSWPGARKETSLYSLIDSGAIA